ncbi:enoyl-CoA hydratase-related protein [Myxococcota bacterium]|nr:enoyl-CoA hydratase-related protein [Myxococcota bacterium]
MTDIHGAFPDVRLQIDAGIARITLDRPGVRNALRAQTTRGLIAALSEAARHPEVRVLWLTGEGGSFCAGADLADAGFLAGDGDPRDKARARIDEDFHPIVRALHDFPRPTMAVIPGSAVGFGFDMALACDARVAAADAKLGPIFAHIGLVPDGGGTYTLPRLIGPTRALEWIMTAQTRTAAEVESWGLLNRVVPAAELESTAAALAARLAAGPPLALAAARRLVREAQSSTFEAALTAEREAQVDMLTSRDFGEGVAAWFERRAPRFEGR